VKVKPVDKDKSEKKDDTDKGKGGKRRLSSPEVQDKEDKRRKATKEFNMANLDYWSNAETARRFLVLPETISGWKRRDAGLVSPPEPVNKYPDLTRYAVQRLKTPNEVRFSRKPANEQPRIEPRATWTSKMKCARPHAAPYVATRAKLSAFALTIIVIGIICLSFPLLTRRELVNQVGVGCARRMRVSCVLLRSLP